jgi:hypothetical protein
MQIIIWILGAVAAYRLWEHITWLSIVVILLALSYGTHHDEKQNHDATGLYSKTTGTRLMWTFIFVVIIFVYSLFI